ncbi:MAG: polysaccharide deacetylase family protein [Candidatus Muiribacteriota bacterium]
MFCISIDFENWFHSPLYNGSCCHENMEEKAEAILNILEKTSSKASFYVVGNTVKTIKKTLIKISEKHEIAFHSEDHTLLYHQCSKKYFNQLKYWKNFLEDVTGKPVKGHRAPAWSLTPNNNWLFDSLIEAGFIYDNSYHKMFFGTPLWNKITLDKSGLWIIPQPDFSFMNFHLPFSGSFLFRINSVKILEKMFRLTEKKYGYSILYTHPWEICPPNSKTLHIPQLLKFYNLSFTKNNKLKFEKVINQLKPGHTVGELLEKPKFKVEKITKY